MTSSLLPGRAAVSARRDYGMTAIVLIALLIFVIAGAPIVLSLLHAGRYKSFVSDFTEAVNSSHSASQVTVVMDGDSFQTPIQNISDLYKKILGAGMGKEQKDITEEPSVTILFHDGSAISFQESAIPESTAAREIGLLVSFTKSDGSVYQYDTDRLTLDHILRSLRLKE